MATQKEVENYVKTKREGSVEACFGPSRFGALEVWEVWVHDGAEYQTRFVTADEANALSYFSDFHQYNAHVSDRSDRQQSALEARIEQQRTELQDLKSSKHHNLVLLYVAATVFVASVAVLLFLNITGAPPNAASFGVLASLVASGAYMFFGAWISGQ